MSTVDKYRANAAQLVRNPDDPVALVNQFAVISETKANGKHYLPLAKRAYDLAPNDISPCFNYGSALHRVGRFEEGLAIYLKCLKIADEEWLPKVTHHVGVAYRALNENKKAAEWYLKAYEMDKNP